MPIGLLTLFKLLVLVLLYLFLLRVVRIIAADLYGGRAPRAQQLRRRPVAAPAAPPKKQRRPPRELVVQPPNGRPEVFRLGAEPIVLGRVDPATVVVDDIYVSDEHAEVQPDDHGWLVRDLGSTNGTFLNGAKVTQPTSIVAGDQLRIGKTRIEVRR